MEERCKQFFFIIFMCKISSGSSDKLQIKLSISLFLLFIFIFLHWKFIPPYFTAMFINNHCGTQRRLCYFWNSTAIFWRCDAEVTYYFVIFAERIVSILLYKIYIAHKFKQARVRGAVNCEGFICN